MCYLCIAVMHLFINFAQIALSSPELLTFLLKFKLAAVAILDFSLCEFGH